MVFNDSDKFIRLYFDRVYKDENALVVEEKGQIVSALQMIPYTMTFFGNEITVAYISGAGTLPSEQGKGYMGQLLRHAFEEMKRRNIDATALIPAEKWLFDYYRKLGYTEVFEYSLKVYTRHEYLLPERDLMVVKCTEVPDRSVYDYFDSKLRKRTACVLHTYEDFVTILKDLKIGKGKLFIIYNMEKVPVGMAFVLPPDKRKTPESVTIKEILYEDMRVKKHLLFEITRYFKVPKAVYRLPYGDKWIPYPLGMARVINRERLIRLWLAAHPEEAALKDQFHGMDVQTLTGHLFDFKNRTAYMSLMLD